MKIPFMGGSYQGRFDSLNSQRCINLYPHVDNEGGKSQLSLQGTPGLREFYDASGTSGISSGEVRGMIVVGNLLYAVIGAKLIILREDGDDTVVSGALGLYQGRVWMAHNGTEIMIVEPGNEGYIYDIDAGGSVTAIADADFPIPQAVVFLDGYFIVIEKDTFNVWISASYDGTVWTATDYATAEKDPDELLSEIVLRGQLFLFGPNTIEVWYNSGASDYPFEVITTIPSGTRAPNSIAKDKDSIFYLDDLLRVVRLTGYKPIPISTAQVEYQIQQYGNTNDAIGYTYTQEGHDFYVLFFPGGDTTWVYDINLGFWHERQSYHSTSTGIYTKHRGQCYVKFRNKHIVGDYDNYKLYEYDLGVYSDDGNTIQRRRTAQVIHDDRKYIFFHSFEIDMETGIGLASGQGSDPQIMLDWSDDNGKTWSNELWADIGKMGEYNTRVRWQKLGRSRNRIFRVTISDPIPVNIMSAHLEAERGTI